MLSRPLRPRHGFGLIEILVVIVIIAILLALVLPRLTGKKRADGSVAVPSPRERAKQVGGAAYIGQINQAIMMYRQDNDNQNPPNLQALKQYGVTDEMMRDPLTKQMLPYDPRTGVVGSGPNAGDALGGGAALPRAGGF